MKAMKKIAGTLKLDQAQFRELEAFAKFGSDLDAATLRVLDKGRKNVEILKQGQYQPVKLEHMIAIIYCGTKELLRKIPVEKVKIFETEFVELLEMKYKDMLTLLKSGVLNEEVEKALQKAAAEATEKYNMHN